MDAKLAPELASRLERLAQARHTDVESLLSEAIRSYLDREETGGRTDVVVLPPVPPAVHLRSPRLAEPQDAVRFASRARFGQ